MKLTDIHQQHAASKKLFSEIVIVDWYDGAVMGFSKVDDTGRWYVYNLCYFEPSKKVRIFTLVEIPEAWLPRFMEAKDKLVRQDLGAYYNIKSLMKDVVDDRKADAYLLKTQQLEDADYSIVTLPAADRQYFDGIGEVMEQDDDAMHKWISYFK